MLNAAGIEALSARKRLLVAECESHRRAFTQELAQFQSSTAALTQPIRSALSVSRVLALAAPFAGFALGRRKARSKGWWKMGLIGWQLIRRVQPLWTQFRKRRRDRR